MVNAESQPPRRTRRDIFLEALNYAAPEARAVFLDNACGGDGTLRNDINSLLQHFKKDSFLESPAGPTGTSFTWNAGEKAGDAVGRYRLMEKIGEGGFGEVFVAEQREPVKRHVALKIIKAGMDTRQVVARFEAERQALALMEHEGIAKVLDAGAMPGGRPYFVMELVRGIKITDYCDQNKLSTDERLGLFTRTCRAVQHAHQRGVIHRDLKPSNILVTLHDGSPVPKVIDFGIAKATQGELTDKTIYTELQMFMGTPVYMSPEQAEMSGLPLDFRSDIYSLGVLLYELLTGHTPLEQRELQEAGVDAMRRMIREREPVKPSTRLSGLSDDARHTTAHLRRSTVPKLLLSLRGDLDWIVLKCLEKDRVRRYDSAQAVAEDIQRFLNDEMVHARPPGFSYRLRKFSRRHRSTLVVFGAVLVGMALGLLLAGWIALRLIRSTPQPAPVDPTVNMNEKAIP